MIYGYTIFYVDNVEATIDFYERAFGFQKKFITPEKDYGELISGSTTIAFGSIELGNSNFEKGFEAVAKSEKPVGMELVFISEDIDNDYKKAIDEGATSFEDVKEKPWGQQVGYVRDINGILIEICTPMKT